MALTAAEEALVRELIAQNPELLSLAGNEATIISKLGATKKNLSQLAAALSLNDTDLLFTRQGTSDKSVALSVLKAFVVAGVDLSGYLQKSGGTMTGLLKFAAGSSIASAATVNLSTATGNTVHITGTTGISAWTMSAGQFMNVIVDGILTLTHNATTNNLPGAANITTAVGDRFTVAYDGTTTYIFNYQRADGTALVGSSVANQQMSLVAAVSASGTAVDITGIPSWAKKITVLISGLSTNGVSIPQIQLGTSGGIQTSGYTNGLSVLSTTAGIVTSTAAFQISGVAASSVVTGEMRLTKQQGNTWICGGEFYRTTESITNSTVGGVTLSGVLDRVRLTISGGVDVFDAGSIALLIEGYAP